MEPNIKNIILSSEHNVNSMNSLMRYLRFIDIINNKNMIMINRGRLIRHHILPRYLFPQFKDLKKFRWNSLSLTPREHITAHAYLSRIFGGVMRKTYLCMRGFGEPHFGVVIIDESGKNTLIKDYDRNQHKHINRGMLLVTHKSNPNKYERIRTEDYDPNIHITIHANKRLYKNVKTGEILLLDKNHNNEDFIEYSTKGMSAAINPETGKMEFLPSAIRKELGWKGVGHGKATVLDKSSGRYIHKSITDEDYGDTEKYEPLAKGVMKNKSRFINKSTLQRETLDITDKSINWDNYEHVNTRYFSAKDEFGNLYRITKDDPRFISGELQHASKGAKFKRKIVTCPHCGKSGGNSSTKRWHFDNCKSLINKNDIISGDNISNIFPD